jgi:hypothetical protein
MQLSQINISIYIIIYLRNKDSGIVNNIIKYVLFFSLHAHTLLLL